MTDSPCSLGAVYQRIRQTLTDAGTGQPGLAARRILKAATGLTDADLIASPEREIPFDIVTRMEKMAARHADGEPVSRILGEREFRGLSFVVTPDVLDPRPDSETLIEAALKAFQERPPGRILDLGTGSGCLIVTLLHIWREARGVAVDISGKALAVANGNRVRNGIDDRLFLRQGCWFDALAQGERFDLIVSNPPYIPEADIANLESGVRDYDPILALDGGIDGLESYKAIFFNLHKHIEKNGIGLFEIGFGQADDVVRLAVKYGLAVNGIHADLAGIPRVVEIACGDN